MGTSEIVRPAQLLTQLASEYHHVQQEHERTQPESAARRRSEAEMERIAQGFERVLAHWASDEELQTSWRKHLYDRDPAPEGPTFEPPRLFKGETQSGSRLDLRPAADGGYDLFVDDVHVEHSSVPWHLDPEAREPFHIGGHVCHELFDAPVEALRSLARFLTTSEAVPPWRWARELFEDGVVDTDFGLTPRGRRAIARDLQPEDSGTHRISVCYCVVAADAGRARILTLESETAADEPTEARLVEISDLSNPARRARDKDLFADSRPGMQRESPAGPRHGVDDRRGGQRQEADKKFAELVAEQAEAAWRQYPTCKIVVVAPPRMLGNLRPAIARRRTGASEVEIQELGRDLSRLAPPALHDALAEAGILPSRGRTAAGGLTSGPNGPAR